MNTLLVCFVRQVIRHSLDSSHYLTSLQQAALQQCYTGTLVFCMRHWLCRIPSISLSVHFITPDCLPLVTSLCASPLSKTIFSAWGLPNYQPHFFLTEKKKSLLFLTVLGMCPLFLSNVCLLQAHFSCHSVPSSPGSFINLIPTTYSQQHYFQENCHPLWDRHTKQQQRPLRRNLESNNGVTMEINRDRE